MASGKHQKLKVWGVRPQTEENPKVSGVIRKWSSAHHVSFCAHMCNMDGNLPLQLTLPAQPSPLPLYPLRLAFHCPFHISPPPAFTPA